MNDLTILTPESIKLISFEDHTIKVLLKSDDEVVFKFRNREEMDKAIAKWAKRPEVASELSSHVTLRFPADATRGQIYQR